VEKEEDNKLTEEHSNLEIFQEAFCFMTRVAFLAEFSAASSELE